MSTNPQPGKIGCPHCGALIKAPALAVGSAVNCPKCGKSFQLPAESEVAKPASAAAEKKRPAVASPVRPAAANVPPVGRVVPPPIPPANEPSASATAANSTTASTKANPPKVDNLVDPNLLAPPPPRVKEQPKEVAVVCQLCGTR